MYIQWISSVNTKVTFQTLSEQAKETTLVDSGATKNFISHNMWFSMGIGRRPTTRPMTVYNVDGSENKQGKITHYCWLQVIFQEHSWLQKFFIASLGKDSIILGYPFLYVFNPMMNWQKGVLSEGEVSIQMPRYKYCYQNLKMVQQEAIAQVGKPKEGEAIFMRRCIAQDWAREANKDKATLTKDTPPEEYQRHAKVFSKEESKRFPPEREEDMGIEFKNGAPSTINYKVYPLTRVKWELLQRFLATELELGRIKKRATPLHLSSLLY